MSISDDARAIAPSSGATPMRPRPLVGRDRELRDVTESVTQFPITTLLGPGGVGKTALAVAVAATCSADFPGGVTVVWLGSLRSEDLVAAEVAVQLGLPRSGGRSRERVFVIVMQGHYVAKGKATGESVRAAVAHILEISDGKIVRFDQYVDSATINPLIGA